VRQLQVIAVMLVAVSLALSLAHALELPGKLRLRKETYLAVQQIYYPGFTIGGIAEPLGIIALLLLLVLLPHFDEQFWLTAAALGALAASHAIYWFVTHPVNGFWTKGIKLSGPGAAFFNLFATDVAGDWSSMRDVWEYSHLGRAICAALSLFLLACAIVT
jgi:hypothetical protein